MNTKHTQEPWVAVDHNVKIQNPETGNYEEKVCKQTIWHKNFDGTVLGGVLVSECFIIPSPKSKIDIEIINDNAAARIVQCVNACEGIADPSVVPLILELLYEALPYIDSEALCGAYKKDVVRGFETRILNALARAEGK